MYIYTYTYMHTHVQPCSPANRWACRSGFEVAGKNKVFTCQQPCVLWQTPNITCLPEQLIRSTAASSACLHVTVQLGENVHLLA